MTIDGVAATELISSDFIYSNAGARNETGTAFIDTLFGSRYADVLSGGGAADTLLGGIGADVLNGDGVRVGIPSWCSISDSGFEAEG